MANIKIDHDIRLRLKASSGYASAAHAVLASWDAFGDEVQNRLSVSPGAHTVIPRTIARRRDVERFDDDGWSRCEWKREPLVIEGRRWLRVLGRVDQCAEWIEVHRAESK